MREIKFRLRNKDWNEIISWKTLCEQHNEFINFELQTDELVFMQYTWLKDKTWKEIYEGDVLNIWQYKYRTKRTWWGFYLENVLNELDYWRFEKYDSKLFDVIWNIYENPKLLDSNK